MNAVKLLFGLPLVGAIFLSSCKSNETAPTNLANLGLRQSARLASNVVVRADSIQDSRCPSDVVCIMAGQASVKLVLSTDNDSTTVRLSTGANQKGVSTDAQLNNLTYKVILHEVNPYPTTITDLIKPKTALVEVIKL